MTGKNKDIIITVIALTITVLFFEISSFNHLIQELFYFADTDTWIVSKNNHIMGIIFYSGIKAFFILFVLGLIIALLFFGKSEFIQNHKSGLRVVLVSCISIPLIVGSLKATTNMPCPDQLKVYGGVAQEYSVFDNLKPEDSLKNYKCYPAGHSSGGFALMSLFFLFTLKKYKTIALTSAIGLGWTIGSYKMIIGDHFIGHTAITMVLAWLVILIIVRVSENLSKNN
jgi:membrane-associated PAP2 superfamily phosphatase